MTPFNEPIVWTEREQEAIAELMKATDLSYQSLMRQALRLYQYRSIHPECLLIPDSGKAPPVDK